MALAEVDLKSLLHRASEGHQEVLCPHCEKSHDVLAYRLLSQVAKYEKLTAPIMKCPSCKHSFAPRIFI